jgi:hypothetical protein
MIFAKLYEFSDIGQVLIRKRNCPRSALPTIEISVQLNGVQFTAVDKHKAGQEGLDERDELFDVITEKEAYGRARMELEVLATMQNPQGLKDKE